MINRGWHTISQAIRGVFAGGGGDIYTILSDMAVTVIFLKGFRRWILMSSLQPQSKLQSQQPSFSSPKTFKLVRSSNRVLLTYFLIGKERFFLSFWTEVKWRMLFSTVISCIVCVYKPRSEGQACRLVGFFYIKMRSRIGHIALNRTASVDCVRTPYPSKIRIWRHVNFIFLVDRRKNWQISVQF